MTEPYRKVGRGGAGNFYSEEDVKNSSAPEKTPSTLESQPPTSEPSQQPLSSNPSPEYLHTGRGGAGNWIQPSTLPAASVDTNSTSLAPSQNPPTIPVRGSSKPAVTTGAVYRGGRGGAGNYSWGEEDKGEGDEEKKREEEKERDIREKVMGEVEGGLARPGRAVVGGGGGREREKEI